MLKKSVGKDISWWEVTLAVLKENKFLFNTFIRSLLCKVSLSPATWVQSLFLDFQLQEVSDLEAGFIWLQSQAQPRGVYRPCGRCLCDATFCNQVGQGQTLMTLIPLWDVGSFQFCFNISNYAKRKSVWYKFVLNVSVISTCQSVFNKRTVSNEKPNTVCFLMHLFLWLLSICGIWEGFAT